MEAQPSLDWVERVNNVTSATLIDQVVVLRRVVAQVVESQASLGSAVDGCIAVLADAVTDLARAADELRALTRAARGVDASEPLGGLLQRNPEPELHIVGT